ncbi:glycoside hydrolase family 43 protein [Brachybacterium sp. YJGR34]|uniref:glycoside hydrolase family 43 protein n=1 Tax=Brachybacterium sp. YJGR34 TaxID=2059911 RepID=UPI000E0AEC81|nr:glycoside hydrolase family 43 protein [Brachybacterium sp. YJGR34]
MNPLSRRRLLATSLVVSAATGGSALLSSAAQADPIEDNSGPDLPDPSFTEVSVHDPSVIRADGQFYVFGSHLAAAKTPDLLHWEGVADLVTPENPLFEDVTLELAEAFEWAGSDTLWAADVTDTVDGRFRMYYCACEGSSPRSAMGSAIADSIEGPYVDEGIFLRSGMWDEISEDGTIYDATIHPNAIDPHEFVDAEGRHQLLYGSYSGGIFLLEVDPVSGRPLPGQGYGTHLIGGNHARIEAPYMLYSAQTGYYYLLLTFGGLDADGGYNIRVGRSRAVEGPYLDPMGQDLRDCAADPSLPLFDDASIEPFGLKLMGNHEFVTGAGEDAVRGPGYVSPGHVSAWADPDSDPQHESVFLLFHSRFPRSGELHQVRVHRISYTRDGWPVVSPHRYAGEAPAGAEGTRLTRQDVTGTWRFIDHGRAISADIVDSRAITLTKTGRITGAVSGTWRIEAEHRAVLIIDGQRFDGVFTPGWDEVASAWTPTFSVVGADGRALWGSKAG